MVRQSKVRNGGQALQSICKLVDKIYDDSVGQLMLRLTRIRQKKELLINHLLHQTQDELDYFPCRGEKHEDPPLPRVGDRNKSWTRPVVSARDSKGTEIELLMMVCSNKP